MPADATEELRFPLYYVELAESLVRSRQGDVAQIYTRCGIDPALLRQPGATMSLPQFLAFAVICQENLLPGEPRSIQMLRHLPVTAHGMVGIAAMTSDTLDQALDVGLRYFPLAMPAFDLQRQRVGNETQVLVKRTFDFGTPFNEILTELVIGSFNQMLFFASPMRLNAVGKQVALGMKVELTHQNAEDPESFAAFFGAPVKFGCPENKFSMPRSALQQPLLTSNRNAHAALIATLEQQLQSHTQHKPLTQRVRNLLIQAFTSGTLPGAAAIAHELGLSTRTLSRRLGDEGTHLPTLTEAVRMERAELLLVGSDTPIAKIARELGYAETAAFSRAFKRYSGKSPSEMRGAKRR